MAIRSVCLLFMLLLVPFAAAAQDNPIVQQMQKFKAAYDAGDAGAIAGIYTEDAGLLPPQSKALIGRDAIAAHYKAAFDQGVGTLDFQVAEIRQVGPDAAVEIGETRVKAGERTINGRYMHLWQRSDGVWLIHRDIYQVLGVTD